MNIKLKIIEETFSVCKVKDYSEIDLQAAFVFVGSTDEEKYRRASKEDADVWLAKGGIWSDDTISVWALGSTDSGVSCEIVAMDRRLVVKANYDVAQHGLNLNFHKLS